MKPILIRGGRVIDPSRGHDAVADVLLKNGAVAAVGRGLAAPEGAHVIVAGGLLVCPGLVDLHCHLREPGYEDKETIATGTRAAARGGFTTVCAMPNTRPAVDTRATVELVLGKARAEGSVRVLPIGCVTKDRAGKELAEMAELAEAGVIGFSDDGNPVFDANIMRQALSYSSALGLPIINHCQVDELCQEGVVNEGWTATRLGLPGMPAAAEEVMVARDIALAALTGGRVHLAHVSTAGTVELVRKAKEQGLPVTCEATPNHLTLTEEAVLGYVGEGGAFEPLTPAAYNTHAKVNPPLRSRQDVEALVQGLREGVIDVVATDHAPHTRVDKMCTFAEAAFGISGLETALGSLMALVHGGNLPLPRLIEALTAAPARLLGKNLGTLRKGAPADLVVFDPEAEWVVDSGRFASKGKNTPLDGATLRGRVVATIYGAQVVYEQTEGGVKTR